MSKKRKPPGQKPIWERGYNGHVYWLGKKKLGKVTIHPGKDAKQIEKARKTFELLMDSGEAEGRRDWMREHWKTVEADV